MPLPDDGINGKCRTKSSISFALQAGQNKRAGWSTLYKQGKMFFCFVITIAFEREFYARDI